MKNSDKLSLEFIDPKNCSLEFNQNGFLIMTFNGENKGRVKLLRNFPFSKKDEYICIHDIEDKEFGIIRDLAELDESSRKAAQSELEKHYFCPRITVVKSVKERMGHFYFDTEIDGKSKSFTVRDITRNMRFSDEDTLLIFDMDGNRYTIPEFSKIEQKSRRLLEPYLY